MLELCVLGHEKDNLSDLLKSAMTYAENNDDCSTEYSVKIFNELCEWFNKSHPHNVFVFSKETESSIELISKNIPKEGYGFFGWLNVEDFNKRMCIWKAHKTNKTNLELYILNKKLMYRCEIEGNVLGEYLLLDGIENNRWYFLELYHSKNNENHHIVFYIIYLEILFRWKYTCRSPHKIKERI